MRRLVRRLLDVMESYPHCYLCVDMVGIAHMLECSRESNNGDAIFSVKEFRLHLQFNHLDHLSNISENVFVVFCRFVGGPIDAVV